MPGPLDGVRILDFTSMVSGPLATMMLGDQGADMAATRAFVERRIDGVMGFEKAKAKFRDSPFYGPFMRGPGRLLDAIKAPSQKAPEHLPGHWEN